MKHAVVENGVIVNIVLAERAFATKMGWVAFPEFIDDKPVGVGWGYANGVFTAPVIAETPATSTSTKEQLMAELAALTAKIQALE